MVEKIRFGTDGWRGVIANEFTFDNVRRCAQGFAHYCSNHNQNGRPIIVGYDKRFHSENFALTAAEVLSANGFKVYLTDQPTPTPIISYAVIAQHAAGAVNITASHNPPTDNGFKVRDEHGGAIDPEGLKEIERLIPDSTADVKWMPADQAKQQGLIIEFDAGEAYRLHLTELIDVEPIRAAGLKIVVDAMWGNGAGWYTRLLGGGKTEIIEIHNVRNPVFPDMQRPEPIPPNINIGLEETVRRGADVLIVTDGDADRLGLGDENGTFINQLQTYALLALYLIEVRGQRGAIVKTLSTTSMLEKIGKLFNIPVYQTGVGFKYVAPKMIETDAMIGGEESGGYAFRGNVPERDGILAGLYILDMMVKLQRTPSELIEYLFSKVGRHYYDRIDRRFSGDRQSREQRIIAYNPKTIGGLKVIGLNSLDGFKFELEDGGWLLIRFSGTEPILRVYTETIHQDRVQPILQDGLRIAGLG